MKPQMGAGRARAIGTTVAGHLWARLSLDRSSDESLQLQLLEQIRDGIVLGLLPAGSKLPTSRALALEIGCSRNTVLVVLNRLIAQGYLTSRRGSGVYIAAELPDTTFAAAPPPAQADELLSPLPQDAGRFSTRGHSIANVTFLIGGPRHAAFSSSVPDVSLFPFDLLMQLHMQEWRDHGETLIRESDPCGFAPLREAIAEYVCASRNVACSPEQIIVTSGAAQAVDLISRLLLDAGDRAWVEDPGYPVIRSILTSAGADVVPVPLDTHGLAFHAEMHVPPRLIAVSPSHQFPTGVMMSNQRRIELLEYAARVGAWILEDDYDSEFRYTGQRLAALAGFGPSAAARVIYVGTFSKSMFPAIRMGYLVVPKHLIREFRSARAVIDVQPPIFAQPALARFLADGHLTTHLRRMRTMYRRRQEALLRAIRSDGSDLLEPSDDPGGMHFMVRFKSELAARVGDVAVARRLKDLAVNLEPLSLLFARTPQVQGFVLGFACADEQTLTAAASVLLSVLRENRPGGDS